MIDHLIFDTTDATTMADTHSVGAYVRSGTNGKLITHHTIVADTYEALDVYAALADGSGNPITSTGGALNVNVTNASSTNVDGIYNGATNTDPDNVGVIAHTRSVTPGDTQQVERTTAGLLGTILAADLTKVHALDVNSFLYASNDVNSNMNVLNISNADGGLLTHITNTVTVSDPTLANSILKSRAETGAAALTSKDVVSTPLANRKYLWVYNNDNQKTFIGGTGVLITDGFPISPGSYMELRVGAAVDVEFVSSKPSHLIRTLEAS